MMTIGDEIHWEQDNPHADGCEDELLHVTYEVTNIDLETGEVTAQVTDVSVRSRS